MMPNRELAFSTLHWIKAFGIIVILVLLFAALLFLGRMHGPGGHHTGGHRHAGGVRTATDAGDAWHENDHGRSGGHKRAADSGHTSPDGSNIRLDHGHTRTEHGHNRSADRHRSESVPSFLLALTGGYLAILAVWAALRREWTFLLRHAVCAAAMWLLVVQYLNARGGFAFNQHTWNQSFADASVVLFAVTLGIGPLARIWHPASRFQGWRRETGIWGTISAAVHVGLFWGAIFGWDCWRAFFYPGGHGPTAKTLMGDRSSGLFPTAFNLANVVGLVALAYALVLTITSNDACQRWLKGGWSWLQERATTMWMLVLLHAWLFAYYITVENTLAIGTLWTSFWAVLVLQTAAFIKTVWFRQRN